jgi:hypothetical protein
VKTGIDRRAAIFGWLPAFFGHSDVSLGGVRAQVLHQKKGPRRYLVIHGDETTAKSVLTSLMATQSGTGYVVRSATRTVELNGLKIDPNRLWSRAGAERSLGSLNPGADPVKSQMVLHQLDRHRPEALKRLTPLPGSRLFALHNNAHGYSMLDELEGSDKTSTPQKDQPRYFFLCTDPADFERLRQSPYNVVLQTQSEPDDGSLSRLAARQGFRYINLECALGDYNAQMERVQWLEANLP